MIRGQHENKGKLHKPLKSLKLEAGPAVAFTEAHIAGSGCAFAWPVVKAPKRSVGEVCLFVRGCGLFGGGDGIGGIAPRNELVLEVDALESMCTL
jgi:hypothetical protein